MTLQGSFTPDNLIEGSKQIATEDVLIVNGTGAVARGTVLGRVKQSTPTTGTADGGNTGNGTVTAVTGGGKTYQGIYSIKCIQAVTNGGHFELTGPGGESLGVGKITAGAGGTLVFKSDHLNFTVTDAGTDFALDDVFTVTVTDGVPNSVVVTGTGNGTLTLLEGRRDLKIGAYVLTCVTAVTHGGVFELVDPDGNSIDVDITIAPGAGGIIAFSNDHLAGTITDGSTDFIVGDLFTITITISPRSCVPAAKANTDGSSEPYAIMLDTVDSTLAEKKAASATAGSFNERALIFAASNDIEDFRDKLRDIGIFTKGSVNN